MSLSDDQPGGNKFDFDARKRLAVDWGDDAVRPMRSASFTVTAIFEWAQATRPELAGIISATE